MLPTGVAATPGEEASCPARRFRPPENDSAAWAAVLTRGVAARVSGHREPVRCATHSGSMPSTRSSLGCARRRCGSTAPASPPRAARFTSTSVPPVARLLAAGEEVHASDTAFLAVGRHGGAAARPVQLVALRLLPLSTVRSAEAARPLALAAGPRPLGALAPHPSAWAATTGREPVP
ncbi:hypothetical protein QJS66_11385 [Kocuria rhizophila]|nr:hypothetical protein QJS66_11385 [Kocuria rhizophila]